MTGGWSRSGARGLRDDRLLRGKRWYVAVRILVVGALAMGAPAAVAQEESPSPQQLWDAYPLDPETAQSQAGVESQSGAGTPGAGAGSAASTGAAGERRGAESGDPSLTVPALVGAALLAFAVGLAAGQASRRRAAATANGEGPPARPRRPARPKLRPAALAPTPPPEPTFEWVEPAPRTRAGPPRASEPPRPEAAPAAPPREPAAPPAAAESLAASLSADAAPVAPPPVPRTTVKPPGPSELDSAAPPHAPEPAPPSAPDRAATPPVAPRPPAAPEPDAPPPAGDAPEREPFELPWRRFARDVPWPEADELWTCEIGWKPGYMKSTFRALVAAPGERKRKAVAESPPLRWTLMMDPDPELAEVAEAVRVLAAMIERAGWERTDPGEPWFAHRFVWRGEGRPPRIESSSRQGGTDA
jgi:hypothetical protein